MSAMAEWIYFIHAPRENFVATMNEDEKAVWATHFERLQRLIAEGVLVLAGPTLGPVNTGIAIVEAADEDEARRLMEEDPAIARGIARGELRPFRVALLRGRDGTSATLSAAPADGGRRRGGRRRCPSAPPRRLH